MQSFRKHFVLVIILNVLFITAYAQAVKLELPDYTVHSPNAASLGKYGEYPVNLSTGVPAIQIPLYTIKTGKLEVPLSLTYHASGIKVDQEASFVGLGWVLNAGGVITRVVRDKPDDQSYGFLQTGKNLPDYNSIDGFLAGAGTIGNNSEIVGLRIKDCQPDLFQINVPGLSGDFCLDNNGNFVSTSLDSLRYNVNLYDNLIIITDKEGKTYRFGKSLSNEPAYETTESLGSSITDSNPVSFSPYQLNYLPYSSSWYLTEIISADQTDTVSFKYKTNWYSMSKVSDVTRFLLYAGGPLSPIDNAGNLFNGTTTSFLTTNISNVRVPDQIIFKTGLIQISTENDRQDLQSTVVDVPSKTRITGLTIYNKNNVQLQKISFDNNDYFARTGSGASIGNGTIQESRRKSLKLNGVKFYGADNAFVNDFKFEYDTTPLAPLNTTSQDFWGYYNGKNNSSMIPTTFYSDSFTGKPVYIGEDRRSDINYMKAAVLKKIIFPTGGFTTYDYEPHYYLNVKQQGGKTEATKKIDFYAVNRLASCSPAFLYGVPANNVMEFEVTEDLSNGGQEVGKLYVMFTDYKNYSGQPMTFKITNLTTGESYSFAHGPSGINQQKIINQDISIRKGNKYRLEANTNGATGSNSSICNSPYIEVGLSYTYWQQTTSQDQITAEQAGGLRVKNVSAFDSDGSPLSTKTYEYGATKYGPDAVGVGTLLTDPSLNFYNFPLLYTQGSNQTLKNLLWFSSNSQVELGLNQGAPVFYDQISEKTVSYQNNSLSNGKTDYYFRSPNVYYEPKSGQTFPYQSKLYPLWDNSDLVKVIQYKSVDNNYVPVKSVEYQYNEAIEKRIKTVVIHDFGPQYSLASTNSGGWMYTENPNRYQYYNFYTSCGRFYKVKEISNDYENGIVSLTSEKAFNYNKYYDLSKESGTDSKGIAWENNYKYTGDLDYSGLLAKHILSLPAQSEELLNGQARRGIILKYNDYGTINERYSFNATIPKQPVTYSSVNSIPDYYEKKESLAYNNSSKNIQELGIENLKTSYLWSYNNEHIIAEIKNADYSVVQSILTASGIDQFSKLNPDKAAVDNFIAPLKAGLPEAMIITYTYEPMTGVTSHTDSKGQTSYYEYDNFQRLRNVKDEKGNIIKNYNYHYKP